MPWRHELITTSAHSTSRGRRLFSKAPESRSRPPPPADAREEAPAEAPESCGAAAFVRASADTTKAPGLGPNLAREEAPLRHRLLEGLLRSSRPCGLRTPQRLLQGRLRLRLPAPSAAGRNCRWLLEERPGAIGFALVASAIGWGRVAPHLQHLEGVRAPESGAARSVALQDGIRVPHFRHLQGVRSPGFGCGAARSVALQDGVASQVRLLQGVCAPGFGSLAARSVALQDGLCAPHLRLLQGVRAPGSGSGAARSVDGVRAEALVRRAPSSAGPARRRSGPPPPLAASALRPSGVRNSADQLALLPERLWRRAAPHLRPRAPLRCPHLRAAASRAPAGGPCAQRPPLARERPRALEASGRSSPRRCTRRTGATGSRLSLLRGAAAGQHPLQRREALWPCQLSHPHGDDGCVGRWFVHVSIVQFRMI